MIANCITISRLLLSLALFAISPSTPLFTGFYLLCGVTDMLDGFIARKMHTESKLGELLDSVADLFFAASYVVKILPKLHVPFWIWIWTAAIAAAKLYGILQRSQKEQRFCIAHSFFNKLTGLLIFLLPLTVPVLDVAYSTVTVCAVATLTAAEEILMLKGEKT